MSRADTIKRHRLVACPYCGVAAGEVCRYRNGDPVAIDVVHGARKRAYLAAHPRGRKPTGPTTCNIPVRVPTALWRAFADRHGDKARAVLEGLLAC